MVGIHANLLDSDSHRKAMREWFFGERFTGSEGSDYGYALRVPCERFGGSLANGSWLPASDRFFDTVRAALDGIGVNSIRVIWPIPVRRYHYPESMDSPESDTYQLRK